MSTTEEKLHKLKVVELKDLLAKHSLVQTGKKDDLIKRLLDNNVTVDDNLAGTEEELTDPPATGAEGESGEAYSAAPAPPPSGDELLMSGSDVPAMPPSEPTLTSEQQAMKARAERFGVPFNPNPTSTKTKAPAPASTSVPSATATTESKTKSAGPIDKASLGIPDETLAKRAARFGLPKKMEDAPAAKAAAPASASKPKSAAPEVTPEQAAKNAEDEEKKRKRAEKFGVAKPVSSEAGPDAKKAKV